MPLQGSWRPPTLSATVILLLLLFPSAWRAYDYMTGNDGTATDPNSPLSIVERAAPLWIWGSVIATGIALLLIGMVLRWTLVVITGHVILMCAYAGLAGGLLPQFLDKPWLDGIRSATGLLVVPMVHIAYAATTYWDLRARQRIRDQRAQGVPGDVLGGARGA